MRGRYRLAIVALSVCVVSTSSAGPLGTPSLRLVATDSRTLTLGWPSQSGVKEYRFYADDRLVSRTFDGSRTRVRFWLGARTFTVDMVRANGTYSARYIDSQRFDPSVTLIELEGSISSGSLEDRIDDIPVGRGVIVRPSPGGFLTIHGDLTVARPRVVIQGVDLQGTITFEPNADDGALVSSTAMGFDIFGADGVRIEGNTMDGNGIVSKNIIWDEPAGETPDNWRVVRNAFSNYFDRQDESVHSEALYIGYSTKGLIQGNTFINNGTTAHVFFTWFGSLADPSRSWPRDICVSGNTFGRTHDAYYAVNFREEIPLSSGIRIDPERNVGLTTTSEAFNRPC